MKTKVEIVLSAAPVQQPPEDFIRYIKQSKKRIITRNWLNNKETIIDNPCDEKSQIVYHITKSIDKENPMPIMMPTVYFDPTYCSSELETWEEIYLKNDLFISLENLETNKHRAFSLETVFLHNKNAGFLRTGLRYDDRQHNKMSELDQERFLNQLKIRYPMYYNKYLEFQPSATKDSLEDTSVEKSDLILNAIEVMLVLSCHVGGLHNTALPGSISDALSAYGYQLLIQTLSENLKQDQLEGFKCLWAKSIHTDSEKTVEELINSALGGACTTKLGMYWLGLLRQLRPSISLDMPTALLTVIFNDLVKNNTLECANLTKSFLSQALADNKRFILRELVNSLEVPSAEGSKDTSNSLTW